MYGITFFLANRDKGPWTKLMSKVFYEKWNLYYAFLQRLVIIPLTDSEINLTLKNKLQTKYFHSKKLDFNSVRHIIDLVKTFDSWKYSKLWQGKIFTLKKKQHKFFLPFFTVTSDLWIPSEIIAMSIVTSLLLIVFMSLNEKNLSNTYKRKSIYARAYMLTGKFNHFNLSD